MRGIGGGRGERSGEGDSLIDKRKGWRRKKWRRRLINSGGRGD